MCRWLAYSGSPVLLEELLYGPKHSLIVQSLHSQLGAEETNGDGFGIGWYGAQSAPAVFHITEPAWNDRNLRELAGHINSGVVFAHVRASTGSPVQQTNCHPFRHGQWLWMHNGLIHDFQEWLEKLAPSGLDYHHHQTGEDNADAHLKRTIMGHQVVLPITNGALDLGPWEQVFYAEFDGRRKKRVVVKVMGI